MFVFASDTVRQGQTSTRTAHSGFILLKLSFFFYFIIYFFTFTIALFIFELLPLGSNSVSIWQGERLTAVAGGLPRRLA